MSSGLLELERAIISAAGAKAQGDEIQQTQEAIEDTEVTVWLYG